MGYSGARLAPLFSPEPAKVAAQAMVALGRRELLRETVQNTPIDDSPFPSRRPGTARASWHEKPVEKVSTGLADIYETGVITEDDVATYLEYGTGLYGPEHRPYIIRPKTPGGMLRFYSRREGRWVYARSVTHPGIHPQRPLQTAVALVEHRLPEMMAPILEAWIVAAELRGRTAARV